MYHSTQGWVLLWFKLQEILLHSKVYGKWDVRRQGSSPDLPLTSGVALGKSLCFFSTVSFLTHIGSPHKPLWTLYPGTILERIGKGAEIWKTKFTSKILKKTKDTISTRTGNTLIVKLKSSSTSATRGRGSLWGRNNQLQKIKKPNVLYTSESPLLHLKNLLYLLPRLKGT